jgi:MFS family permease
MRPVSVAALGIGQCLNWGVLYYAFAVLVLPLERELHVSTWTVTGAFSLALLVSAAAAPTIGRWADHGRGPMVMELGGVGAGIVLVGWTLFPGVLVLYLAWALLGLCMAATLYEPAFVIVGRAFDDPLRRLRALAAVTLFGGVASTVFLPGTAFLANALGWRGAVIVLAAVLLLSTGVTRVFVFRRIPVSPRSVCPPPSTAIGTGGSSHSLPFDFVVACFALASFTTAGFTANLVPALGQQGASPGSAALLGGLMGVMQLPGRALLMNGIITGAPARLVAFSLTLHAVGLGAIAAAPSVWVIAAGTMTLALGAGLTTLVRPHVVQTMFAAGGGGYVNGRLARYQQLARAAGPLTIAWLGSVAGYAAVFASIAGAFVLMALISQGVLSGVHHATIPSEPL